MGQTARNGGRPLFRVCARNGHPAADQDGCIGEKSHVMGTYIHGLFDSPDDHEPLARGDRPSPACRSRPKRGLQPEITNTIAWPTTSKRI